MSQALAEVKVSRRKPWRRVASELANWTGELTDTLFNRPRISAAEMTGAVDRYGRPRDSTAGRALMRGPMGNLKAMDMSFPTGPYADTQAGLNNLSRVIGYGLNGMGAPDWTQPKTDDYSLAKRHIRNEVVFRCIDLMCKTTIDPRLKVQRRIKVKPPEIRPNPLLEDRNFQELRRTQWDDDKRHKLGKLMMRPNPKMSGAEFMNVWMLCIMTFGWFFAKKIRSATGVVVQLWPLMPCEVEENEYGDGGVKSWVRHVHDEDGEWVRDEIILDEDMLVDKWISPMDIYFSGVSPVAVASASIEADLNMTDFVRQFLGNNATPSGILKVLNKTLTQPEADDIKRRWFQRMSRWFGLGHSVAVMDQNAEYQPISSKLNELDSEALRSQIECRICMVFGVPPILIGTYVGVDRATYSNSDQAERHWWSSTVVPWFKKFADKLTWNLLIDFELEDDILEEKIRIVWDFTEVKALQEDVDALHKRARENVTAGIWTVAEAREKTGVEIDPYAGYYTRQTKLVPSYPDVAASDASLLGAVPSVQVIATNNGDPNSNDIGKTVNAAAAVGGKAALEDQAKLIDTSNPQADAVRNATVGGKQTKPN